jgi:hypothetical protein
MRQMGTRQLYIILRNIVVAKGGDIVDARKTNLLEDFQWCMFEAPNDAVTTLHKAHAGVQLSTPFTQKKKKRSTKRQHSSYQKKMARERERERERERSNKKNA